MERVKIRRRGGNSYRSAPVCCDNLQLRVKHERRADTLGDEGDSAPVRGPLGLGFIARLARSYLARLAIRHVDDPDMRPPVVIVTRSVQFVCRTCVVADIACFLAGSEIITWTDPAD